MIIQLTNKSKNFYAHLGKVFGSRKIQKITGDRFYDDDKKVWYVYFKKANPIAFVSIQEYVIKNVWSEEPKCLIEVLNKINTELPIKTSIVPAIFKNVYIEAGFEIMGNDTKNFVKIRGVNNVQD